MEILRKSKITQDGIVLSFEIENCNNEYNLKIYLINRFDGLEKEYVENLIDMFVKKITNTEGVKWNDGGFRWIVNKNREDIRNVTNVFLKEIRELIEKLDNENKKKGLAEWLIPEMKFKI